jgi:hypothetical protein
MTVLNARKTIHLRTARMPRAKKRKSIRNFLMDSPELDTALRNKPHPRTPGCCGRPSCSSRTQRRTRTRRCADGSGDHHSIDPEPRRATDTPRPAVRTASRTGRPAPSARRACPSR